MIRIDKHKIYESHGYHFINFVDLSKEQKEMVLLWRNHENVRKMMVNKEIISFENHLAFIEGLKDRDDCYYWLVIDPMGRNIGVLDITHVNEKEDIGEIGYYLCQDEMGGGFEFMIECDYFVFHQLELKYNMVTIDTSNKDILLFNMYLGATFEGIKVIGETQFVYNNRATGDYFVDHYEDISLVDYARFVSRHKKDKQLFVIK